MIKHVVMWRLRGTSTEERHQQGGRVRACLEALRGHIPGMLSLEVGLGSVGDEQLADVVLISTHDDLAAFKAYLVHPSHVEAARVVSAATIERRSLDFEVASPRA
jgi:hypothetical protein